MLVICLTNFDEFFQYVDDNLSLMSVGFLLSKADEAVIWRGPKKNGTIPIYYFIDLSRVHIPVPCSFITIWQFLLRNNLVCRQCMNWANYHNIKVT